MGSTEGLTRLRDVLNEALQQPGNLVFNNFTQNMQEEFPIECRHMTDDEVTTFWGDLPDQVEQCDTLLPEEVQMLSKFGDFYK